MKPSLFRQVGKQTYKTITALLFMYIVVELLLPSTAPSSSSAASAIWPLWQVVKSYIGMLTWPVQVVCSLFNLPGVIAASGLTQWFPITSYKVLEQSFSLPAGLMEGGLNWWGVISLIFYSTIANVIKGFVPAIEEAYWFWVTEYIFKDRQLRQAEQALNTTVGKAMQLEQQKQKLAQETVQLKETVVTDELTKIFNRRFFMEKIGQTFTQFKGKRGLMTLVMLDIDYFKRLNDTYGHQAGDEVLRVVSGIIKEVCPANVYPCRYGGEEFALIMPGYDPQRAYRVADTISRHIQRQKFPTIDPELQVTLSQGICSVNFAKDENLKFCAPEEILEIADQQLYRSKLDGRNRISSSDLT